MATSKVKIWYDKTDEQSILAAAIAYVKYNVPGVTFSVVDTSTKNEAAMLALVTGTGYTDIVVACKTQATYSVAGGFTYDQVALMDGMFTSANRAATVLAAACGANSTATEVVLTGAAGSDDDYIGYNVRTAGVTAVYRYITDYTASGEIATIADTTTPVTTTSTFVLYENSDHLHVVGNASVSITATHFSWVDSFSGVNKPLIVSLMAGSDGSTFAPYAFYDITATSVSTATLTDTSHYTLDQYTGKNYYVGIESGTTGAGEVHRIVSNTVSVLTLNEDWGIRPTGTIKYMITDNPELVLARLYLPYSIKTYLWDLTNINVLTEWSKLLDKYDFVNTKTSFKEVGYDTTKLLDYIARGKAIFDAKCVGVVT
jgi:hypothetical protein